MRTSETNNLATAEPAKLAELQQDLARWQKEIKIPTYDELAYPAFEKVK